MFPPSLPENFNAQEWKGIFVQALENVSFWNTISYLLYSSYILSLQNLQSMDIYILLCCDQKGFLVCS